MAKLYIGFSTAYPWKIGSEIIKCCTKSPYSHVYVRFTYNGEKDAIFHAAHGMVHFRSPTNFLKANKVVKEYEIDISDKDHSEFFDECMELAGEKYAFSQLIKIAVADLYFNLFKKEIHFEDSKGYICSELVGTLLKDKLGFSMPKPVYLMKPKDIDCLIEGKLLRVV